MYTYILCMLHKLGYVRARSVHEHNIMEIKQKTSRNERRLMFSKLLREKGCRIHISIDYLLNLD